MSEVCVIKSLVCVCVLPAARACSHQKGDDMPITKSLYVTAYTGIQDVFLYSCFPVFL